MSNVCRRCRKIKADNPSSLCLNCYWDTMTPKKAKKGKEEKECLTR